MRVCVQMGSSANSPITPGVPNFFQDLPTGDSVKKALGVDDAQLAALPARVLNLSPYANWSDGMWNILFHGNVYKQPRSDNDTRLDKLADGFLAGSGTDVADLPPSQQVQARNQTAHIYVVQQADQNVTMRLEAVGGGTEQQSVNVTLPDPTTSEGDFGVFVPVLGLDKLGVTAPEDGAKQEIQQVNVYARSGSSGTDAPGGNATAYLVPPTGLTVVSDIDDILRVTKIYAPKEGLLNSFARPFVAWDNMPQIYANWSQSLLGTHFHYLTTTPEQVTPSYADFIFKTYPPGSFDTRPLNFSDVSATLSIRRFLLDRIFQTFPHRAFVLVADTSNSDVMKDYPALAKDYPGQVRCIFLRNTSATDSEDKFPYDTSGFKGLDQNMYMFFRVPDDLAHLDIAAGRCYNASIPQNVTFNIQDELLGIHNGANGLLRKPSRRFGLFVAALACFLGLL